MSVDIDAIRKKLKNIQNKANKKSNLFKPENGETTIRIVPYKQNPAMPFIELYFHYNFNKKTILSPVTFGRPDPIMEFAEQLQSTGSKEDWKLGKRLEPKQRNYVPIVVRGKEKEGVKFWGFGIQIYEELLKIMADPDYGDITDVINGTDIVVDKKSAEESGNDYGKIAIRAKRKSSPLTSDKNLLEKLLTEQDDIFEMYKEPTYEELKEELGKWLHPEDESEEVEEDAITENDSDEANEDFENEEPKKSKKLSNEVDDILKNFDDLMNQ